METGDSGTRQSNRTTSAGKSYGSDRYDHYKESSSNWPQNSRDVPRDADAASTMATAALISPNTPYYPHHPNSFPSTSSYASSQSAPGPSAMISPVESRRTSDDRDMAHRQSLPSIQEVIGKGASSSYTPTQTPSGMPPQSLPSAFTPTATSRPYPSDAAGDRQQQHSPHSLHHSGSTSSIYNPRSEAIPPFSNALRPPYPGRPQESNAHTNSPTGVDAQMGPMQSAGPGQQPPQPQQQQQQQQSQQMLQRPPQDHLQAPQPQHHPYHHQAPRDPIAKHESSPAQLNAYQQSPAQQPYAPQPGPQHTPQHHLPAPPGQIHLPPSFPVSPQHAVSSSLPSPFEAQQHPLPDSAAPPEFNRMRARYDQNVNRHFEAWSYAEYLTRIGSNARTIYNFAEAFAGIAREEHAPQPIPGRMPSDREVYDMINNAEWLKTMLENLRSIVQQTVVNERGPANNGRQSMGNYEDNDVPMYPETLAKPYGSNEVKKRRGRAAPPGRCHSCNRIDTPEWRRGPDGARTLCNACGLHYAKLERKKQLENRQLRPKHPDERH